LEIVGEQVNSLEKRDACCCSVRAHSGSNPTISGVEPLEEFLSGRMPEQRMGLHEVMEDVEERWRIVTRVFPIHDHPTRFGSKEVPWS
jgi:hypothetical protein